MREFINIIEQLLSQEEFYSGDEFYEAYGWLEFPDNKILFEADYHGRNVTLNKPMRSDSEHHKFMVYTTNGKGNVVKVHFGDPDMRIKRTIPARRKSYRARHHCDTHPGPKWKANYWSCKKW